MDSTRDRIRDPCIVLTVSTYSIGGMVEKPLVSAFQNLLWIENRLNIKKVMGRNVWMCFCIDCFDIYSIECIRNTYALC